MDKSEKIALSLGVLMLSVFFFAIMVSAKVLKQDVPECISPEEIFETGELIEIEPGKFYQVKYVSKMWAFEPAEITIPAGSELDIYLASHDIVHGFYVRGTNINMMAVPGALNFKSMKFRKPGVYDIFCHEYCGTGHQFMKGRIIVTP
jgi:cytochrome c oxidase subunit II